MKPATAIKRIRALSEITRGRVCPDCNLIRTETEYKRGPVEYLNCVNCWPKRGKKVELKSKVRN